MKTLASTAILALMTTTLGLAAIAPSQAQTTTTPTAQQSQMVNDNVRPGRGGPPGGGDLLGFERGAEAVEIALVRLSYGLDLTAEQQPLFDAFKADALAAATQFESATADLRPVAPVEGETAAVADMSERLTNAIALQTARLDALKAVQPSATAFFDSLSDEQKTAMTPQRPERGGKGFGPGRGGHHPMGDHGPDAPIDAPAANN